MATSQLTLYNGALRLLGQTNLEDTDEASEARYVLDNVWDENARDYCLEAGWWNFAMRSAKIEDDTSVSPTFGFVYAFAKPTDWIRTHTICFDEYFQSPMNDLDYSDEGAYWYADIDTIYVRYVSNDAAYGYDLSIWPQTFVKYFECYMAEQACMRITQNAELHEKIEKKVGERLRDAIAKDGLNEGVKHFPAGNWARARAGGAGRRDRGSRGSLSG